jgi:hypothetical protein
MSSTAPPTDSLRHRAPPSWVDHSPGPYSQPSRLVANSTLITDLPTTTGGTGT